MSDTISNNPKLLSGLQKRLDTLEQLIGAKNNTVYLDENSGSNEGKIAQEQPSLFQQITKAEDQLKELITKIQTSTNYSQQSQEISSSLQKINDFLKKTEMKYATTIIGSKNRADLILRQEADILTVIAQLELVEKYKKTLSFDPVVGVAERKQQVDSFEFMSQIKSEGGPLTVQQPTDQTIAEAFLSQNENIESFIKDQASIIDSLNKKFLYFDAVLTQLEKTAK